MEIEVQSGEGALVFSLLGAVITNVYSNLTNVSAIILKQQTKFIDHRKAHLGRFQRITRKLSPSQYSL